MIIHCLCNNSIDKYINTNKAFPDIHVSNNCKMGKNVLSGSWKINMFSVAIKIIAHFQVCIVSMNALYVCDVPKMLEVFSVKKNKKFCLFYSGHFTFRIFKEWPFGRY